MQLSENLRGYTYRDQQMQKTYVFFCNVASTGREIRDSSIAAIKRKHVEITHEIERLLVLARENRIDEMGMAKLERAQTILKCLQQSIDLYNARQCGKSL